MKGPNDKDEVRAPITVPDGLPPLKEVFESVTLAKTVGALAGTPPRKKKEA
jgi:hypothetical protein